MDRTVAAIATATGEAGVGMVRMTGIDCFDIADRVFRGQVPEDRHRRLLYGHIVDGEEVIDEVLLAYMEGPRTYTRENMVEIYTHGGLIAVRKVLQLLLDQGADLAGPGEFTKRAFLNGRLDLAQAEAVIDMIQAKTDLAYENSLGQLEGSLTSRIQGLRDQVLDLLAYVEYSINFTEDLQEELPYDQVLDRGQQVLAALEELYESANQGRILREGVATALVGKPNVGKSSLLNALLRENKAIVTDIPGTTRDVIEESIDLGGVALKIWDTAGIRSTEDQVEKIGVERSIDRAQQADLVLALFDQSRPWEEEDEQILSLIQGRQALVLLNKTDLEAQLDRGRLEELGLPLIPVSIKEGQGLAQLEEEILALFLSGQVQQKQGELITNIRHRDLVKKAMDRLATSLEDLAAGIPIDCIEVDLRSSWEILGQITGETIEEDVLDKIFSDFCIGK